MPLRFNMLLEDAGISPGDVRLLRHQTGCFPGRTPYTLWRDDVDAFWRYQAVQNPERRAYFNSRYWASFVVPPDRSTLFVGLFETRIIGPVAADAIDPLTLMRPGEDKGSLVPFDQYECLPVPALVEIIGRLKINWGDTSSHMRSWAQRADNQDKLIVELAQVFQEDAFPGFTRFVRPLSEIETMPASWREALYAAKGVYLLACPRTREHYVGAALGIGGFLGRWRDYVANNHGGNVALRGRPYSDFNVSILEVAGSAATDEDIMGLEVLWKEKLQSRSIGLNRN